jgi:hypothetical protein
MDYQNEQLFKVYYILDYIKQNFIGFIMLIFAFLIIYIVDHINNYNMKIFSLPTTINTYANIHPNISPPKAKKHKKT